MAALNFPILKGFTIIMEGLLSRRVRSISDERECTVIALINLNPVGRMDKGWGRDFFRGNVTV